jgi:proline iminopeptidase
MMDAVTADDGCMLWAERTGSGPPLLLCHGGPGLWDMFAPVAAMLGDVATVIRWDQRGGGRSERRGPYTVGRFIADVDAVRLRHAGARMALLGHSWGATLALLYALRHPGRVSKLIYVSGVGIDGERSWKPAYEQNLRMRLGEQQIRWDDLRARVRTDDEERDLAVLQWSADFADSASAFTHAHGMATPWFDVNDECNKVINAEVRTHLEKSDVAMECRELAVPALVLDGAEDIRPRSAVESLLRALPIVRRVSFAGVGHVPWLEVPDRFRRAVIDFLVDEVNVDG